MDEVQTIPKKNIKHPKILATIIFFLLVGVGSFVFGYTQDTKKTDENGNKYQVSHNILNGMKWVGIIYAIFIILAIITAIIFKVDFFTLFFFGGEIIGPLFEIIGHLISALGE